VPTRANTQPAFGFYLQCPQASIARPYGLLVLTLEGDRISAITWFFDTSVFSRFGYREPCANSSADTGRPLGQRRSSPEANHPFPC
jgi:hypothetical protein